MKNKLSTVLVFVCMALGAPGMSQAAGTFLKLEGVKGATAHLGENGWHKLQGFAWMGGCQ